MLSHEEMVGLQRESHDLIDGRTFQTKEQYTLHLMHTFAYETAASLAEDIRVLDLGCNTGYGSEILSRRAMKVCAVDVSQKAIDKAKTLYGRADIDFFSIDGKSLPFEDKSFDLIVSCQVIEHIVDHTLYLGELKRVLATNGLVFFTTPNASLRLHPGMKPWNKFHVREYTHRELSAFLSKHFTALQVFGMEAKEPLYSIEKNRLTNQRENARKRHLDAESERQLKGVKGQDAREQSVGEPTFSWRKTIKSLLPQFAIDAIRRLLGREVQSVSKEFMKKHGLECFSYCCEKFDEALDLMALCSASEESIKGARELIEKRR